MRKNRNIRVLAIHNFLVGFILFGPVAILYFERVAGSFALGMSVFSAAVFSTALFEVPTGVISDRVGRRFTVVLGSLFYLLAYLFYALGFSYVYLLVGAVCAGIGEAFYSGNNDALLYDTLKEAGLEKEYEHYLGRTRSLEHFALAVSAVAGSLVAHFSFQWVMWLSVIPQIANLIVSFFFYEPATETKEIESNVYAHLREAFGQFMKNKKLRLLSLASFVGYAFGESAFQFRAAFIKSLWPVWAIGFSNVLANVGATISYYYSGSILKRFGAKTVMLGSKVYSRIIHLVSFIFPTIASPALITTSSLFHGVNSTAKNNLFQKEFTDEQRATMSSITSFFGSIVFGLVAILVGLIADQVGPVKTLIVVQIVLFVPILIYKYYFEKY